MPAIRTTRLIALVAIATSSALVTACSSNPAPTVATHPPGLPYLSRAGTGAATLPSIALPSKWTLIWHFNCMNPASRRSFVLNSTPDGGKATMVTNQTGLEGGGYRPFTKSGVFTFAVSTTCSWRVLAGTAEMQTIPTTAPGPNS